MGMGKSKINCKTNYQTMCFVAFGLADRITIGTLMGQEL
jgi:hypothetical protein